MDKGPDFTQEANQGTYNTPEIAAYYAALEYVTPCERLLFKEYLREGMNVLDLGVGGGRTTACLSSIAGNYVGVDYAPEMIAACRKKFPRLRFQVGSATDLSSFASSSFRAVVMAFNGMDYIVSPEARRLAWGEICRVMEPEGVFIVSSHNARSIFVRPSWDRNRVRAIAESLVEVKSIFFWPLLSSLTVARVGLAYSQAAWRSAKRIARSLPTEAFWRGQGCWLDPVHGGLLTHVAIPEKLEDEARQVGLHLIKLQGDDYPLASRRYVTGWYYYVFSKSR